MKNLMNSVDSFCTIDASTNSMAFAYFEKEKLIRFGKIKYQGNTIYEKIIDTSYKTKAFFSQFPETKYMVIEQPIYLNSPKTAANLAMSHGALVSAASLSGVRYVASVSPMVWQNWSGNKRLTNEEKNAIRKATPGKSESWYKSQERLQRKQRTIKFVNNRFDLHVDDDDVADAIAIGAWTLDNWKKVF